MLFFSYNCNEKLSFLLVMLLMLIHNYIISECYFQDLKVVEMLWKELDGGTIAQ